MWELYSARWDFTEICKTHPLFESRVNKCHLAANKLKDAEQAKQHNSSAK